MKIGLMGAMPEEVSSLRALITCPAEVSVGSRTYLTGRINDIEVVLCVSRYGKVASSCTATALIATFNITHLIFVGVAGATSSKLRIGDIVIAKRLFQYDMDASPLFPRFEIPLTGQTFFQADKQLTRYAIQSVEQFFTKLGHLVAPECLSEFNITQPSLWQGLIGTGDQFVSDVSATQAIMSDHPETLAVEMEGAAVAQVCCDYGVPFVIIRTISDLADHKACINFVDFIREIASLYAGRIVGNIFEQLD